MQQCNIYLYNKKKERQQNYSSQLIIAGLKMHFKKMKNKFFKSYESIFPKFLQLLCSHTFAEHIFRLNAFEEVLCTQSLKLLRTEHALTFVYCLFLKVRILELEIQHFISMWPLNIQLEEKKEFWIVQLRNPQLNRIK